LRLYILHLYGIITLNHFTFRKLMSDTIGGALPYPYQGAGKETGASETTPGGKEPAIPNEKGKKMQGQALETTPGGKEPARWVAVGTFNPAEAAIIRGRLESQDIPAVIQQEAVGVVMGLTVGPLGSARVLVPESLLDRALAVLAETFEVEEDGEEEQDED
jgi:hypothetical protein